MILVDTSVWVKATREKGGPVADHLDRLLALDEVATTDLIIAEVLQGARNEEDYAQYEDRLRGPHYFPVERQTWLNAARLSYDLRRKGFSTPLSDLIIASLALEHALSVYAIDAHFDRVPSLQRHEP
jgi:predicted nucleic acid-binding protein